MRSKRAVVTAAVAAVLAMAACPVAAAAGMQITATGGSGTAVDRDGTQGEVMPAVQGTTDADGDQDAHLIMSQMALPQFKAVQK
ncbi:MAG: hypothetical protein KDB56_03760 [Mycobacterium sp.]|nr:hypothetical protein [Mycobacterium sp.]